MLCLKKTNHNRTVYFQNCDPETTVCCTYRPPPTTTTTTTTSVPVANCAYDSDCVTPDNCRNGEISAINYVKKQGVSLYS